MPDVNLPYVTGLIPLAGTIAITNCAGETNCVTTITDFDYILNSGDYFLPTPLRGKTAVIGIARLVLPAGINMAGNDVLIIASSASLQLHSGGSTSTIAGNGIVNEAGSAGACQLRFTAATTTLNFNAIGETICTLLAPGANIRMNGAGSSTNDFVGSLAAKSIVFNGNFNFHFDEQLLETPLQLGPPSWLANGGFSFTVTGSTGSNFVVEASSNLSTWTSLTTNTAPFVFVDDAATNFLQRYYRARLP